MTEVRRFTAHFGNPPRPFLGPRRLRTIRFRSLYSDFDPFFLDGDAYYGEGAPPFSIETSSGGGPGATEGRNGDHRQGWAGYIWL